MTRKERRLEALRNKVARFRLNELIDWYHQFKPSITRVAMPEALRMELHNNQDMAQEIGFTSRGADGAWEYRGMYLYRHD